MKKFLLGLGTAVLVMGVSGCGSADAGLPQPTEAAPTGILVPAAEFTQVKAPFASMTEYCWVEDTLLYREDKEPQKGQDRQTLILQVPLDASEEPQILKQAAVDEEYLFLFFSDREDNLYFFGKRLSDNALYLQKQNIGGEVLYCNYMGPDILSISSPGLLNKGFADSEGNVYLLDHMSGTVYFFNARGEFTGTSQTELTQGTLLDAGDKGRYLWQYDFQGVGNPILLQKIDADKKTLGPVTSPSPEVLNTTPITSYTLLSGYEKGILLSTSDTLYQYDPLTNSTSQLLNWNDGNINIEGSCVESLRYSDWNSDDLEGLEVLLYDRMTSVAEAARIKLVDKAYLPEKQTVLLGILPYSNMDRLILGFNRNSSEYQIKPLEYDNEMLEKAMMYGKEQIPDILDIQWITPELLTGKDLLENLDPYFKKSNLVKKEDILPVVWESDYINEKHVGATLGFYINTIDTWAETLSPDGWTPDQFFALEQEYPDSRPLKYYLYMGVWRILTEAQMNRYINFEKGECDFDNPEFISLLEQINALKLQDPDQVVHPKVTYTDEEIEDFISGEFLLRDTIYMSPYDYHSTMVKYKGKAKSVGYPTENGQPWYVIQPTQKLAIYRNSSCKDGAWAFIEYLLSQEEQDWYGESFRGFPVRQDAFETYLDRPFSQTFQYVNGDTSEEQKEQLRYMAANMHVSQIVNNTTVNTIISEELQAFIAGDKTAAETAAIIQNRIQLYLDEV